MELGKTIRVWTELKHWPCVLNVFTLIQFFIAVFRYFSGDP